MTTRPCKPPISGRCPMLDVDDLHAYYGKSHILQGVTLRVGEGEIVSLLGRNGAGRSTAVKTIMGQVRAGRIRAIPGRAHRRARAVRDRAQGPGLCSGGPRDLSGAHRPRESAARHEVVPAIAAAGRSMMCSRSSPCCASEPTRRRRAFGRRAADADDLPDVDGRSRSRHGRRADRRPRPAAGRARARGCSSRSPRAASRSC